MAFNTPVYVKQPNAKSYFTQAKAKELIRCSKDLVYFCENYVMIQHPIKGNVPFTLYPFQKQMLNIFAGYKYVTALTARQMGKSLIFQTLINFDGEKRQMGELIPMTKREKIVSYLEDVLLKLSK